MSTCPEHGCILFEWEHLTPFHIDRVGRRFRSVVHVRAPVPKSPPGGGRYASRNAARGLVPGLVHPSDFARTLCGADCGYYDVTVKDALDHKTWAFVTSSNREPCGTCRDKATEALIEHMGAQEARRRAAPLPAEWKCSRTGALGYCNCCGACLWCGYPTRAAGVCSTCAATEQPAQCVCELRYATRRECSAGRIKTPCRCHCHSRVQRDLHARLDAHVARRMLPISEV